MEWWCWSSCSILKLILGTLFSWSVDLESPLGCVTKFGLLGERPCFNTSCILAVMKHKTLLESLMFGQNSPISNLKVPVLGFFRPRLLAQWLCLALRHLVSRLGWDDGTLPPDALRQVRTWLGQVCLLVWADRHAPAEVPDDSSDPIHWDSGDDQGR